jgi:predicted  nucleic acid-binding Zn-ribbon protein
VVIENFLWGTCGFSFGMVVSLWIYYVNQREKPEIDYDKINSKLTRGANTRIEELQTEVKTLKKQDSRLAQRIFELEKQLKINKS